MTLYRYQPFRFDDLFWASPARTLLNDPFFQDDDEPKLGLTGYNVTQNDIEYQVSLDVPGMEAGDIKLEFEENGRVLHVSGGRKIEKENLVSERRFSNRFTLAHDLDASKITANLENGVLTIKAPKKPKLETTRTIAIEDGRDKEETPMETEQAPDETEEAPAETPEAATAKEEEEVAEQEE